MSDAFPPALPHGPLVEVLPDLFFVTGRFRMFSGVTIARNMTIVREGGELTVINSVRLDEEGERELQQLGRVKHLMRIGAGHGADDPYYVSRFGPTVWAPPRMKHRAGVTVNETIKEGGPLPTSASALVFGTTLADEVALRLPHGGGTLVTCDSMQNWTTTEGCSLLGAAALRLRGFMAPAKIGPFWLERLTPKGGSVRADFERLLQLDFKHLLSGHGTPLLHEAKEKARISVANTFGV